MVLPLILSLLGSGAAGAGLLGTGMLANPLIAGAIGSGLGTAIETGDLEKGIASGLGSFFMGNLFGKASDALGNLSSTTSPEALATGMTDAATTTAANAAATGTGGLAGMLNLPAGTPVAGTDFATRFAAARAAPAATMQAGLSQGIMTPGGLGTALGSMTYGQTPTDESETTEKKDIPQAAPLNRTYIPTPAGYRPGMDPEHRFFSPVNIYPNMAQGGAIRMMGGGLAEMDQGLRMFGRMAEGGEIAGGTELNDKDVISAAVMAVKGELAEQEAAIVLAQFVQKYGEDALRALVDDVQSGREPQGGEAKGMVEGPGDGMSDMVPARIKENDQDVLLSDGEFVVPADVVSGLGNGSSDAGANELYGMMDRVRAARTGKTEQPKRVNIGGLMPA